MWFDIVLIFVFILLNGFFAAAEIAVVTARRTRIKQLIDEGRKNAAILKRLREEPDKFLATIQIGVTLAVALASVISGALAHKVLKPVLKNVPIPAIAISSDAIAIGVAAIIITYFSIVLGELIPKTIALSKPETVGLFVAPLIDKFSKLANIFVKILTISTNILLKPFGKRAFSERGYISEEEIKMIIEEGRERGIFEAEEKELIHSVFEFTDIFVKEVMVPAPQMVTMGINMTVDEVKTIISEEQYSRYPVVGKDLNDIRGILYAKDFFNSLLITGSVNIRRIIKSPLFIPETLKIGTLLREMQKKRIHMAIVIDEYGSVSGLVTLEDLIEEIVGEIRDEYDTESPVIQLGDGTMIIDASISIRDINEDYYIAIPESPEYETLGGFIVTHLQRIPQSGDEINIDNKKLTIIGMVGRRISKVKIENLPEKVEQK
ncbi:MAG: HlyC/CorC family transporter [Nitrospirae bacterium]|nr:HlyC/CorC family transporter [Nitrospirota bacterium]